MSDLIAGMVRFPTVLFIAVGLAALVALVIGLARYPRVRRAARGDPSAPRPDLVGKTCVIRTDGRGDGHAEVTDAEGSTRVIQIRPAAEVKPDSEALRSGSSALIYDYDNTGGFFMVAPLAKRPERTE